MADARRVVSVPVVGVGEALRAAIAAAPQPVYELSGDVLAEADPTLLVLEPLDVALDACLEVLDNR